MSSNRPKRDRKQVERLVEEQALLEIVELEYRALRRSLPPPPTIALPTADESDEDAAGEEKEDLMYEEKKKENEMEIEDNGWKRELTNIPLNQFLSPVGPGRRCRSAKASLDFFSFIISPSFIERITDTTNRYARNHQESPIELNATADDIRAFLSILIAMGISPLPSIDMYWSNDWKNPFISSTMPRHRFESLSTYFYLIDPRSRSSNPHPLQKILPLLNEININSRASYNPSQHLAIDEAMIPFKGRQEMKQYIPMKPTRWGFRAWMLCDCIIPYSLHIDIYTGKANQPAGEALSSSIVKKLVYPYYNQYRIIYMDNFYSSPELFNYLLENKTYAIGTLRVNRKGLPRDLIAAGRQLYRGQYQHRQKGNLVCTVWVDKAPIYFLSTCISPLVDASIIRRSDEGKEEEVKCPAVVAEYNKYVHGVDTVNQLRQSYAIGRISRKWYRPIIWWLIDIAIINAYTLARLQDANKWKTHLRFREELMKELAKYEENGGQEAEKEAAKLEEQSKGHHPFDFGTLADCAFCSKQHDNQSSRHRSKYGCQSCRVHLCVYPCHALFHEESE